MRKSWFALSVPILALAAVFLHSPTPRISTESPPDRVLSRLVAAPVPEAAGAGTAAQIEAWVRGIQDAEWFAGVQAELDRQAAAEAARAAQRSAPAATPRSYGGVGDCTGFAIPDYIIQRESGGNPWAVNKSSGAFGCGQVMPFHWNGGGCSDLDQWTIEGQRECVDRLSSGGTNLNPWAATR